MNDILSSLFNCAMRDSDQKHLTFDELRSYHKSLDLEEKLEEQLEQSLEGESLQLFQLYVNSNKDSDFFADASSFRSGLAIGLKLAAFCMLER